MNSPRLNETINVKYIVIQSFYNNRLLSKSEYANILYRCIGDLNYNIEDNCESNEGFQSGNIDIKFENDEINIIPDYNCARLLFTKHIGYTWIDEDDAQGKIYSNNHSDIEIKNCLDILDNSFVDGSFVIELYKRIDIEFKYILTEFIRDLTEAKYCGFFDMSNMDAMYDHDKGVIYLTFDTESG